MKAINLNQKFSLFHDHWSPKIIGELNGQEVRIAKVKGEFIWHQHQEEDELFFVIQGQLKIEFRDRIVEINPGEMLIVPKGTEHKPIAEEEVWLMLFEPAGIKHTGEVKHELTVEQCERI
jgi:mannose-6-phosphate isomerase-like protein (cupin superfamily)